MLRRIRITIAVICIIAVTALFLDFTGTARHLWGWLAKIQFIPALLAANAATVIVLVAATLLFGRLYCSIICPLGIMQDAITGISTRLAPRSKRKSGRFRFSKGLTWVRVASLVLFLALIALGLTSIAGLIEPYSAFGRMASQFGLPIAIGANNLMADWAAANGSYTFGHVEPHRIYWPLMTVAAVTLLTVGAMAWFGGRIWCNTICPVGTILGFLSRFALLRPVIDTSKCNGCGRCARNCKAKCINPKLHKIDMSRCVVCMNCIGKCTTGAISYRPVRKPDKAASEIKVDPSRRQFLGMTAVIAGTAAVSAQNKLVDGGLAIITEKQNPARNTPIVPPGAVSIRNLSEKCTACQLCISACPNGVLRPRMTIEGFMQPEVGFERGYCRPECTACSNACPTGAIKPLTVAERTSVSVGKAVVNLKACIAVKGKAKCGNCARHCPAGAISMVEFAHGSRRMPVVNDYCIGCGACENLCPVSPISAITVDGRDQHIEI